MAAKKSGASRKKVQPKPGPARGTKPRRTTSTKKISTKDLVARLSRASVSANIQITFTSGIGQATASLFRNGVLINLQSVSSSATIFLSDVQRGDTISINGVCTGNATIAVSVPTSPETPEHFAAGNINTGYDVL
jgi:hypothetical protein